MPDQETIIPDVVDNNESPHSPQYWAAIYDDLQQMMTIPDAAKKLGIAPAILYAAVNSDQLTPFQFSAKKVLVTPRIIAEWAEKYCRIPQGKPLPG